MPRGKHRKPTSRAQAGLFGAVAGGRKTKAKGLSRAQGRADLRGVKVRNLPARKSRRQKA